MKKLIIYFILAINCFAIDYYDIQNLIFQKDSISVTKEKYENENYSLSKITLLNFDIDLLNKEMELTKTLKEYKKEKLSLKIFIENEEIMKKIYDDKIKFYDDYLKIMEKNKDKFTVVDINEAKTYLNKSIEENKIYEKNFLLNKQNYNFFYSEDFQTENLDYQKWLKEKIKNYEIFLNNKIKLMEISEESKFNLKLAELEKEKTLYLLEKESKTLELKELENNKGYQILLFKLEITEKEMEAYKLRSEKKQKELTLGLITQKDYFDFSNEKFKAQLQKNEIEKEIKLMKIELGIEKGQE